jgi:hypothetical protein
MTLVLMLKSSFKSTKVFVFYVIWLQRQIFLLMLLIHTTHSTNRFRYIVSLLLERMLGMEVVITDSAEAYLGHSGPGFTYGSAPLNDGLFFKAAGLLFENVIYPHEINPLRMNGIPILFPVDGARSALPYDPFAAAFYMVTRYEEYHAHKRDKYGRFQVRECVSVKGGFLEEPVVHLWAEAIYSLLKKYYPGLEVRRPKYQHTPTIDIDHAYAYLHRPLFRAAGAIGRSLLHGRFVDLLNRLKVITGSEQDPYDNYKYICDVHAPYKTSPLWFYLFADYGGDDNNIPVGSKAASNLLRQLDHDQRVGIHPSLSSNKHYLKLESEYKGLCRILDRRVTMSRQHFLKISLPKTYRSLIQIGITDDYSMGFASHPGFRAGIALPFPFFDLTRNEETPLIIHPVSIMDVTLKDYLRLTAENSLETISRMVEKIKSVDGEFVSLWHNESLSDSGRWEGWRAVYEAMLQMAAH